MTQMMMMVMVTKMKIMVEMLDDVDDDCCLCGDDDGNIVEYSVDSGRTYLRPHLTPHSGRCHPLYHPFIIAILVFAFVFVIL